MYCLRGVKGTPVPYCKGAGAYAIHLDFEPFFVLTYDGCLFVVDVSEDVRDHVLELNKVGCRLVSSGRDDEVALVVEVGGYNFQVFGLGVGGKGGVDFIHYGAGVGSSFYWEALWWELHYQS